MAKPADAKDLGSFGATHTGSIPAIRTTIRIKRTREKILSSFYFKASEYP